MSEPVTCFCPTCRAERIRERDRERREMWKHRAAQKAIERSGCCSGQLVCPCPNCKEVRDFWRTFWRDSSWRWRLGRFGWQKMDKESRRCFGPTYRNRAERDEAWQHERRTGLRANPYDRTTRTPWDKLPPTMKIGDVRHMTKAEVEALYARVFPITNMLDDRNTITMTLDFNPERPMQVMLTPLEFSILIWRKANPNPRHNYPVPGCDTIGAHRAAIGRLNRAELIEFGSEQWEYTLTGRAEVLLNAVLALPLPVREPAPWKMP